MAVTGKIVILIVFVVGIIFQSPQMILRPGLLRALINNFTEGAFNIPLRISKHGHSHKSFLRGDPTSVMDNIPPEASKVKYLNQDEAIQVDVDLLKDYKFGVDTQLMELAGLSVATAVAKVYESKKAEHVLVVAGPGNNGGDGFVVARHLKMFGFENVTLLVARKPTKEGFLNLIYQAEHNQVMVSYDASSYRDHSATLIVDALFGFSFKPPVRPDYQPLMDILVSSSAKLVPVVAVDIPSGWDVENGPPTDDSIRYMPDMLVSLTAPKLCANHFQGSYHFLGGRFVPKTLADKYALNLPPYPGTECVVRLK
ncbi:unnamed protein product [Orchesella dallaii]|uniref:NAD(P)H-hydrate epimerase n=1 Tax=Orchesella dallaii TaxID=48710 RepID=A0ABP1PK37_9HEXA